jgi:hypothetical protein
MSIFLGNITSLKVHLYLKLFSRTDDHRDLKFSVCRLVNSLTSCAVLKRLRIVLKVDSPAILPLSRRVEPNLKRLLAPFDVIRDLEQMQFDLEGSSTEKSS